MALSTDFLEKNVDRVNAILDRADVMGDGVPVLGTLILLNLTDDEWDRFVSSNADPSVIGTILADVEKRFRDAGVRID